jgi:aldose sugar dehydrogenase
MKLMTGPNDILVLEKNKGVVDRIVNGKMLPQPLLQIKNIASEEVEWGLLGIDIDRSTASNAGPTHVEPIRNGYTQELQH